MCTFLVGVSMCTYVYMYVYTWVGVDVLTYVCPSSFKIPPPSGAVSHGAGEPDGGPLQLLVQPAQPGMYTHTHTHTRTQCRFCWSVVWGVVRRKRRSKPKPLPPVVSPDASPNKNHTPKKTRRARWWTGRASTGWWRCCSPPAASTWPSTSSGAL